MKSELQDIISKKYAEDAHLDAAMEFSGRLLDALEDTSDQSKSRFTAFLQKYNFETIPLFSDYPEYPTVTLFKGVDSWTLCPVIDYEGGVTVMDQEIGIILRIRKFI